MDVRPGNLDVEFWKDIEFWKDMLKLAGRLAMLAMVVLGGTEAANEVAMSGLKEQEAKAATVDNRVLESVRETDVAYDEYHELVRYHAAQDAGCDTALEMRRGPDDFAKIVEECHSEGEIP